MASGTKRAISRERLGEILGASLIAITILLFLALVTDGYQGHVRRPLDGMEGVPNALGKPGAVTAGFLSLLLGGAAHVLYIVTLVWGVMLITHRPFDRIGIRAAGLGLMIVGVAGVTACQPGHGAQCRTGRGIDRGFLRRCGLALFRADRRQCNRDHGNAGRVAVVDGIPLHAPAGTGAGNGRACPARNRLFRSRGDGLDRSERPLLRNGGALGNGRASGAGVRGRIRGLGGSPARGRASFDSDPYQARGAGRSARGGGTAFVRGESGW